MVFFLFFFFNDTATTEIYTLSLHDALPISVIETVVTSVLASAYRPLEVLVVDDRSTDDTAARVGELARRDPRLRLIAGEELPPGWYGKPWACLQGYRAARG